METAKPQRRIGRLSEIGRVATRHGFGYLIDRRRGNDNRHLADRGRRLREMLDELGPTFVKFGQLLSTRPDVMPPDIIAELRKLQDDVSPIPFTDVRRVVEEELGLTVEEFARSIRQELDYQHEARNAETFRRNFADSEDVAVPRVIWRYSSSRVLT